jgi:hypothetical protein
VVEEQAPAELLVDGRGVLQHHAEVVGELPPMIGLSVEHEARAQVGLLEPQQRHPALAGVPVREVGQEQAVAPPVVERLDVEAESVSAAPEPWRCPERLATGRAGVYAARSTGRPGPSG